MVLGYQVMMKAMARMDASVPAGLALLLASHIGVQVQQVESVLQHLTTVVRGGH